ncbi:MAG: dihydropteroate synthase [Gemmatimonadaceae bacterium]
MPAPQSWTHAKGTLPLDRPIIMGILNVTPDSFSDGGQFANVGQAVDHARQLVALGADIIDVGGESTRPQGARQISVEEELNRVVPVIRTLVGELPDTLISIDTNKSIVAMAAVRAGAAIVNDVSGFRLDARMADVCSASGAGVVLMHSRGGVADMASYSHAEYDSVVDEVVRELNQRIGVAREAGIAAESIAVDPGIGFAKRGAHSLLVLSRLSEIADLGYPVVVGVSRKRFIAELTDEPVPANRVAGTVAANVTALERGARIFRVHDVRPNRQALDVAWAIMRAADPS